MPAPRKRALVYRGQDTVTTAQLAGALEDEGLEVWRTGGKSLAYGDMPWAETWVELRVPEEDFERARELTRAYLARRSDGTGWRCPGCGEELARTFTQCWSCGAERGDAPTIVIAALPPVEAPVEAPPTPAPESVLLYRARDTIEASLLIAMLEEEGVPAWRVGGGASLAFGDLGADAFLVDVHVWRPDVARAHALVTAWFERAREEREVRDEPPWNCAACGEEVDAEFDVCWCCGAAHGAAVAAPAPPLASDAPPLDTQRRWSSFPVRATRGYLALVFTWFVTSGVLALYFALTRGAHLRSFDALMGGVLLALWVVGLLAGTLWALARPHLAVRGEVVERA